ncbi:MAG: C4-dicarboxylate ABC transporter permease [Polaromonas sp.]|nr:C4-dicarboxylate ABC transporter permease [Polaromonas sp.]
MLDRFIDRYCQLLSILMTFTLAGMVIMVFGNVVMRYAFNSGITESEELSRWAFVWLIFMGATVALRERAHMGTDMLVIMLPKPLQQVCLFVAYALMLFATWIMFKGSVVQTQLNWDAAAPVTGLSQAWLYSAGVLFSVSSGLLLVLDLWKIVTGQLTLDHTHPPAGLEPTGADLAAHPNNN